jgi:hypothetical protein
MEPELPLIEAYLGALHAELAHEPERERIVAEAEDHLRESVKGGLASGLSAEAAQREAIRRFGSPAAVATALLQARGKPRVFDARGGLPEPALHELRHAMRLSVAVKDERTAVLGYWVPDPSVGEPRPERFGAIVLSGRDWRRNLGSGPPPPIAYFNVARDKKWRQIVLPELHAGIQLQVESWAGELRLWFGPIRGAQAVGQQIHLSYPARPFRVH